MDSKAKCSQLRASKCSLIVRFAICLLLAMLVTTSAMAASRVTLNTIRYRVTDTAVRIVLDLNKQAPFTIRTLEKPNRIVVEMPVAMAATIKPQIAFEDKIVRKLTMVPQSNGTVALVVEMNGPAEHKVFSLKNPDRIVVDINKLYDFRQQEIVYPGVKYTTIYKGTRQGPETIHVLDIAPTAEVELRPVLSNDIVPKLETVSSIAARHKAIAAINANYFAPNGEILGLLKIDARTVSLPTDNRCAIGWKNNGQVIIGHPKYTASLLLNRTKQLQLTGINTERGENGLVMYTPAYGHSTKTNRFGMEYVIEEGKVVRVIEGGNAIIPPNGFVISVHDKRKGELESVIDGDEVQFQEMYYGPWQEVEHAVGAGPLLVLDGKPFVTAKQEKFGIDVDSPRAPRTAIGLTKNKHILLVVVDGRNNEYSVGLSLWQLADLMKELGAEAAVNLDGGGSSEMVIHNMIVNRPSDGRERPVGSAIMVVPRR